MRKKAKKLIKGFFYLSLGTAAAFGIGYTSYKVGFADGRRESADTKEAQRRLVENQLLRRELAKERRRK